MPGSLEYSITSRFFSHPGIYPSFSFGQFADPVSPDEKLKICSWNTELGGTYEVIESIAQYKCEEGLHVRDISTTDGAPESDFEQIGSKNNIPSELHYERIDTIMSGNKTYYLAWGMAKYSNLSGARAVVAYELDQCSIKPAHLFKIEKQPVCVIKKLLLVCT